MNRILRDGSQNEKCIVIIFVIQQEKSYTKINFQPSTACWWVDLVSGLTPLRCVWLLHILSASSKWNTLSCNRRKGTYRLKYLVLSSPNNRWINPFLTFSYFYSVLRKVSFSLHRMYEYSRVVKFHDCTSTFSDKYLSSEYPNILQSSLIHWGIPKDHNAQDNFICSLVPRSMLPQPVQLSRSFVAGSNIHGFAWCLLVNLLVRRSHLVGPTN